MLLPGDDHIPEPRVFLMGCQPWPPPPRPDGLCPVCGHGIRREDSTYHCGVCDSSAPEIESRCLAARIGLAARPESEQAERTARQDLDKLRRLSRVLTERQRRRIWMGYGKDGIESRNPVIVNRARVGREWLIKIEQLPSDEFLIAVGYLPPNAEFFEGLAS